MKTIEKYLISEDGKVVNSKTGRELKKELTREGYHRVTLCVEGKPQRFLVHRLVAELFIGSITGFDINHKDGCKTNNHYQNLEIVTRKDNIQHSVANRLRKVGGDCFNATLDDKDVHLICQHIQAGLKRNAIMLSTGVKKHVFDDIRRRRAWKHISVHYVW